ncbi:hypothetical protein AC1031_001253 [Aphanomyces cochlioides]|nr:hypothetical protein AC1031_001253 [Aphanomyces cochlioides]
MLCEVPPADLLAGQMRAGNADTDFELLVRNSAPFVERGLKRPSLFLWEVDGVLVAFGGYATPVNLGDDVIVRLGPKYVDASERRKGYGSALVAALSHHVKQTCPMPPRVCLNADVNNPAAKKAYQNVGFVMHSRSCAYGLDAVELYLHLHVLNHDSKIIPWSPCSSQRLQEMEKMRGSSMADRELPESVRVQRVTRVS